jgi:hypothetical protein
MTNETSRISANPTESGARPALLGPFLGYVTPNSIKIWLHLEGGADEVHVTVHAGTIDAPVAASGALTLHKERLWTDCVTIGGLTPDTRYFYRLWTNAACSIPLDLQGLTHQELYFRTLSDNDDSQIDFLIMSCHNPTVAREDGFDGHAVWADIPQIIAGESNRNVRFALLVGDQVYADDWQERVIAANTDDERLRLYLDVYRTFWSHIHYRRVLCALPAMMMWDDHDITDGWGSTVESFLPGQAEFKPEWQKLFNAASTAFATMQASRNPDPLSNARGAGFDCCFRIGKWGFVLLDLRTNRSLLRNRLMTPEQASRIRAWIEANKQEMQAVFVVSPVVFSHGTPVLDDVAVKLWPLVMRGVDWLASFTKWGKSMRANFNKTLGDIRDDIRDSWGADENAAQADMILDYLFGLQNESDHPVSVVILSGDIHTSGYANVYSSDPSHAKRSSIPHITSSSVAYVPFNWLMEAIYRHASKTVALGKKGIYSSQISHHFCSRSVAVLSIRPTASGHQFKVKYYLEGYPEPQILLFDLDRVSHRENIAWVGQEKLFAKDYAPSVTFDVESLLRQKAQQSGQRLDVQNSIVDLMKALGMDSSLGARKRLAQQWGYQGALNGSAEMNMWLHQQVMQRLIQTGGQTPELGPSLGSHARTRN